MSLPAHHTQMSAPAHHSGMSADKHIRPYENVVYLSLRALDENVTKLHISHSVQSSPSLHSGTCSFLEVSRFMALLRGPERHASRQLQASSGSLCLSRSSRCVHVCHRPTSKFWVAPAGHHFFLTSCSFTKQVLAQICSAICRKPRPTRTRSTSFHRHFSFGRLLKTLVALGHGPSRPPRADTPVAGRRR